MIQTNENQIIIVKNELQLKEIAFNAGEIPPSVNYESFFSFEFEITILDRNNFNLISRKEFTMRESLALVLSPSIAGSTLENIANEFTLHDDYEGNPSDSPLKDVYFVNRTCSIIIKNLHDYASIMQPNKDNIIVVKCYNKKIDLYNTNPLITSLSVTEVEETPH